MIWTKEMDALLLEKYPSEGARPCSVLFGVSIDAVWHRARKLGCHASKEVQKSAIRRWKDEYDDILRKRYAVDGPQRIAAELKLSRQTVENRAAALGLTKGHWSQESDAVIKSGYAADGAAAVAKVLGVPISAVYHRARRLGIKYDWKTRRGQSQWLSETVRVTAAIRDDLKCGIYAIRHGDSGRMYVGSALDIFSRWKVHLRGLRQGKHHSRALQAIFDKYGPSAFVFEVLEECASEQLYEREQQFMNIHKPDLNSAPNAGSPRGIKRTAEQRVAHTKRIRAIYADPIKRKRIRAAKSAAMREKWKNSEFRGRMSTAWRTRPWDGEEDNYLFNLSGHLPLKELAVVFGRTPSAVQNRVHFLGLSLRAKGARV